LRSEGAMMNFHPDFGRGVGPAADSQITLANCLQRRHEEDLAAQDIAFEKAQALSGSVALLGELVPEQRSGQWFDFGDENVTLSRP
jgi:hypothetical protein